MQALSGLDLLEPMLGRVPAESSRWDGVAQAQRLSTGSTSMGRGKVSQLKVLCGAIGAKGHSSGADTRLSAAREAWSMQGMLPAVKWTRRRYPATRKGNLQRRIP